ncbi:MAG: serine/threonine protein kinase [Myxococcales bacterium]
MVGRVLGKYRIVAPLAKGGMGQLYRAREEGGPDGYEREVALKVILADVEGNAESRQMFIEEGKLAAALTHGNLVQVYGFELHEDVLFLCMELVRGKDLAQLLGLARERKMPLGIRFTLRIVEQVAEGLDYAHRANGPDGRHLELVHRDVSPSNILISFDGAVKLTDFGVARIRRDVRLTQAGVIKGKLSYMSPEQATSGAADRRSDIFSLGVVCWEALTGQRLFTVAKDDEGRRKAVLHTTIRPPSAFNSDVPKELDHIVLKALDHNPRARFPWASELAAALTEFGFRHKLMADSLELAGELRRRFPDEVPATATHLRETSSVRMPPARAPAAPAPEPSAETPLTPVTEPAVQEVSSDMIEAAPPSLTGDPTLPDRRIGRVEEPTFVLGWRRGIRWLMGLAAIGGLAGAGAFGMLSARSGKRSPAEATVPTPTSAVSSAAPTPATMPPTPMAPPAEPARPPSQGPVEGDPGSTPAVPHPAKRLARPRKPGILSVVGMHPWAEVIIDGAHRGWSPAPAIVVPAGRHRITLDNSDEGIRRTFTLEMPEAGHVVFRGDLRTFHP